MLTDRELFNENFYRATNPDVAAAISRGDVSSGFDHFIRFGEFERRNPSAFFDSSYYLQQNQDVAAEVTAGRTSAFEHFILRGQLERRNPNPLFDTSFYLTNNSDVGAAIGDQLTGIEHFVKFGAKELRNPSRFFDSSFYFNQNPDVAQAAQRDEITGVEHYIEYGQFEGRIPRRLFDRMFVFGDSLSDDGNLFALTGGAVPPSPPYFNGRFTNGPVWVEDLAPRLELAVNPNTNFALGGATSGTQNVGTIPGAPPLPGLQQQIDSFVAANGTGADPNGLYVVYAGANDYLGGGSTDFAATVNNLASAVTKLAAVGAKNFMVPNLPNLGLTPGVAARGPQVQQGLALLISAHNSALAATVQTLEQNPNINIISVDVNSLFNNAIANPANFGFTNVTTNLVPGAGTDPNLRGFSLPPGTNPNQYLFWDAIHPTASAHAFIADTALKATTAIPEVVRIL